ncbi:MAG TPA: cupin domain-containing protein [Thermoanaerobaculia bacterium]|nr:cupin domain-containing protein [Thermoanaerobaculia bacterium]
MIILALLFQTLIQITPDRIEWKPAPPPLPKEAQVAVLSGKPDSNAPVPFTLRLRLPAGSEIERQSARTDQHITVLSGNIGVTIASTPETHFPAGSFFIVPFGLQHTIVALEDSVLQISGTGAWYPLEQKVAPLPDSLPSATADASIEIADIKPAPGSTIDASTTIYVVLRYSIRNFNPNQFTIVPIFESTTPGMTFNVLPKRPTALTAGSGTFALAYPMSQILSDARLRKPLRMWFVINGWIEANRSRTIVATPGISYDVK